MVKVLSDVTGMMNSMFQPRSRSSSAGTKKLATNQTGGTQRNVCGRSHGRYGRVLTNPTYHLGMGLQALAKVRGTRRIETRPQLLGKALGFGHGRKRCRSCRMELLADASGETLEGSTEGNAHGLEGHARRGSVFDVMASGLDHVAADTPGSTGVRPAHGLGGVLDLLHLLWARHPADRRQPRGGRDPLGSRLTHPYACLLHPPTCTHEAAKEPALAEHHLFASITYRPGGYEPTHRSMLDTGTDLPGSLGDGSSGSTKPLLGSAGETAETLHGGLGKGWECFLDELIVAEPLDLVESSDLLELIPERVLKLLCDLVHQGILESVVPAAGAKSCGFER
jgi:hypothetical protein